MASAHSPSVAVQIGSLPLSPSLSASLFFSVSEGAQMNALDSRIERLSGVCSCVLSDTQTRTHTHTSTHAHKRSHTREPESIECNHYYYRSPAIEREESSSSLETHCTVRRRRSIVFSVEGRQTREISSLPAAVSWFRDQIMAGPRRPAGRRRSSLAERCWLDSALNGADKNHFAVLERRIALIDRTRSRPR